MYKWIRTIVKSKEKNKILRHIYLFPACWMMITFNSVVLDGCIFFLLLLLLQFNLFFSRYYINNVLHLTFFFVTFVGEWNQLESVPLGVARCFSFYARRSFDSALFHLFVSFCDDSLWNIIIATIYMYIYSHFRETQRMDGDCATFSCVDIVPMVFLSFHFVPWKTKKRRNGLDSLESPSRRLWLLGPLISETDK
jgi:hypothetical protein